MPAPGQGRSPGYSFWPASWQWQPTTTTKDPWPPISLESVPRTASGPNWSATVTTESIGPGAPDWSTPGALVVDNDFSASVDVPDGYSSNWLKATGFGFSVPVGATITDVVFQVKCKSSSPGGSSWTVESYLVLAGVVQDGATSWGGTIRSGVSSSLSTIQIPAESDRPSLWGLSLSDVDINDAGFGVAFGLVSSAGASQLSIEYLTATVYYTVSSVVASSAVGVGSGYSVSPATAIQLVPITSRGSAASAVVATLPVASGAAGVGSSVSSARASLPITSSAASVGSGFGSTLVSPIVAGFAAATGTAAESAAASLPIGAAGAAVGVGLSSLLSSLVVGSAVSAVGSAAASAPSVVVAPSPAVGVGGATSSADASIVVAAVAAYGSSVGAASVAASASILSASIATSVGGGLAAATLSLVVGVTATAVGCGLETASAQIVVYGPLQVVIFDVFPRTAPVAIWTDGAEAWQDGEIGAVKAAWSAGAEAKDVFICGDTAKEIHYGD